MKKIFVIIMTAIMVLAGMSTMTTKAEASDKDVPTMATLVHLSKHETIEQIGGDLAAVCWLEGYEVWTHNGKIVAVCPTDEVRGGWWSFNKMGKVGSRNIWEESLI